MLPSLIKIKSLAITQLVLVLFVCAQLASIQHQSEHDNHEHTNHCESFIKFDNTHANVGFADLPHTFQTVRQWLATTSDNFILPRLIFVTSRDPPQSL